MSDAQMSKRSYRRWLPALGLLVGGGALGCAAIIASVGINRYTATDAFCTSCHTMATLAADPRFQHSGHRANAAGVMPSCGQCHIPMTNWFVETYSHVTEGIKDIVAEHTNNFSDAAVWEARRIELAGQVREQMRRQDSVTCRGCHDASVINPASERGRAAHALLHDARMTCIDCHFNLVHAPVPPSAEFLRGSNIGAGAK